ncbi:endomucin isoform X2 [Lissotriton helveticus]
MQPLGAAVLVLAVANIHWGSTELTTTSANPSPSVGKTATQASQDIEGTKSQQSAGKPVIVSPTTASNGQQSKEAIVTTSSNLSKAPDEDNNVTTTSINTSSKGISVLNSTEDVGQGRTTLPTSSNTTGQGSTEKMTAVFTNTTSDPDSNSTLPLGRGSSSTTSTTGTRQDPTKIGIQTEPTTMFIDYSKATQPRQDSGLSSGPTPSTLEKTRYIAPAVMVPILLVGAVSFIVWKMCQSDPPGSDQNENPKYVSQTGSVQLLSVRTTTPPADVK